MLLDTNILLRTLQVSHPHYRLAKQALKILPQEGHTIYVVPQNLVELWIVATRPVAQNGLGLTPKETAVEVDRIKSAFILLLDKPEIYTTWEALVRKHSVSGKPSHDARLVAAMQVHGLTTILTFDKTGFSRFPGIKTLHPAEVISPA